MCLFPDVDVSHSVTRSIAKKFYQKVCWGFPSFEEDNAESWPSLCDKVCSLQYISEYSCSYLSSNIVFLLGCVYGSSLDVLACHGLPLELYISKTWG